MSMAYSAYDGYDSYSRPMSRRQSLAYGTPYSHQGIYPDPMIPPIVAGDYPQPSYQIYAPTNPGAIVPVNHRLTGPAYDDLDMHDPFYPDERQLSMGGGHLTPMIRPRHRRHSTVSFSSRPPPMDPYRNASSIHIKFKRKGAFTAGIGLDEAQSHVRLSNNESYTLHDLHADSRLRIHLRIKWSGYSSLTYEIPIDGYDGRVNLSTLARRVSRACVHYLQANVIPIVWTRVQLHHLEEVAYGVWQPMLSAR